jgi:hypothetical protein
MEGGGGQFLRDRRRRLFSKLKIGGITMGFNRTTIQPASLDRAAVRSAVLQFAYEEEIAAILGAEDPFALAHDCRNPAGHDFIASCGDVVCVHCAKVAWR